MLLQQIKKDIDDARREKNHALLTILTTLYSEAQMIGKNAGCETSTAEVISVIQKFKAGVLELIKLGRDRAEVEYELSVYDSYLPSLLTRAELEMAIDGLVLHLPERTPKQMSQVMKMLKDEFGGRYDGKTASEIVRERLK